MWMTRGKWALSCVALSLAGAFGAAGSAHAAVYAGSWDPAFGPKFPNLGWTASAMFDVPDACLAQADNIYSASGACAAFSMSNVQVSFYDISDGAAIDSSSFKESFNLSATGVPISGIGITNHALTGINASFFGPFGPSASDPATSGIAGGGAYSFYLTLDISDSGQSLATLAYVKPTTRPTSCLSNPQRGDDCGFSTNAAVGKLTPAIPEPGSYALMLAGLGVMGFIARRRVR